MSTPPLLRTRGPAPPLIPESLDPKMSVGGDATARSSCIALKDVAGFLRPLVPPPREMEVCVPGRRRLLGCYFLEARWLSIRPRTVVSSPCIDNQ